MKKMFLVAALAASVLTGARPSHADPQKEMNDAMARMQQGLPVLQRIVEVMAREGPQMLTIMQRATVEAQKAGGGMISPPTNGELPSAEALAQKFRGLQSMLNVMREAVPIMQRVQGELDPDRLHPRYNSRPSTTVTAPSNSPKSVPKATDPDLQI